MCLNESFELNAEVFLIGNQEFYLILEFLIYEARIAFKRSFVAYCFLIEVLEAFRHVFRRLYEIDYFHQLLFDQLDVLALYFLTDAEFGQF